MSGNSAERLKHIYVDLMGKCSKLSEDTDLNESVQRIVDEGQEHVKTCNNSTRKSVLGMNQQKDIIMRSQTVHDVNTKAVLSAMSKMMDSVRTAKNIESSYMRQILDCLEKCRAMARRKQEMIKVNQRKIADLEDKIRTSEKTIDGFRTEAAELDKLAKKLADRARKLKNVSLFAQLTAAVVGGLLVALTAGLILSLAAVGFLASFNLKTASGCRDAKRKCRQKATEKRNEIESEQSYIEARQGEVTELQTMTVTVKSDIDTIHGLESGLNNLMQGIQSLNIQRSCDIVLGLMQNLQSCAARLTHFEEADSQYRLQNFKVEWNTVERRLTQCSMPFSEFIC